MDLALRLVAILAIAGLAAAPLVGEEVSAEEAGFAVVAVLVALLLLAVRLTDVVKALGQIRGAKLFGVELELAERSMDRAPSASLDNEDETGARDELVDLQLRLEAKLAYLAKHLLARDATGDRATFLTIGSLHKDDLLTREDAVAARALLSLRPGDVAAAPQATRARYLAEAKRFVANFRATVFYRLVEKVLGDKHAGEIRPLGRGGKRRADLQAYVRVADDRRRGLVFPAFTDGDVYWDARRLQERAQDLAKDTAWALIVVPPGSSARLAPPVDGVRVVTLDALVEAESLGALLAAEGLV